MHDNIAKEQAKTFKKLLAVFLGVLLFNLPFIVLNVVRRVAILRRPVSG